MIKKRIFSLATTALLSMTMIANFAACGKKGYEHGDPSANSIVPADSVKLEIMQESNGSTVELFGAQMDPHFLSGCVGRELEKADGTKVTIEESEWENVTLPRIQEMGLSYVRMMALPSWWAEEASTYKTGEYTWDSIEMQDMYLVLDAAQQNNIDVCFTVWLWDCNYVRYPGYEWEEGSKNWCLPDPEPQAEFDGKTGNEVMGEVIADCLKYLMEEKGYTCIKYFTPVNEPNSTFGYPYAGGLAYGAYDECCRTLDEVFKEKGIRQKLKFNLSDSSTGDGGMWLSATIESLYADGVADIVNTHWYSYDDSFTNAKLQNPEVVLSPARYNKLAKDANVQHAFGEYGAFINEYDKPSRAFALVKIAANMWQTGACGMSYWRLQSDFWNWDRNNPDAKPYFLGLWESADGDYNCRPSYYTYSLMTRFIKTGMKIYPMSVEDGDLVGVAFRNGKDWTYLVVNDSQTETKKISFLNNTAFPNNMEKYVYEVANAPTDNKVIPASGIMQADGRVLTDTIAPQSCIVYTNLKLENK